MAAFAAPPGSAADEARGLEAADNIWQGLAEDAGVPGASPPTVATELVQ